MRNMEAIIKSHNAKIMREGTVKTDKACNCTIKEECPFKKQGISCRATNIIYKAEVKTATESDFYIGLSEPEFKLRYNNHTSSFNLTRNIKKPTHLATRVRDLKTRGVKFDIEWSVLKRTSPYTDGDAICSLCLKEATAIMYADTNCLNKRQEVMSICKHRKKFLLENIAGAPD